MTLDGPSTWFPLYCRGCGATIAATIRRMSADPGAQYKHCGLGKSGFEASAELLLTEPAYVVGGFDDWRTPNGETAVFCERCWGKARVQLKLKGWVRKLTKMLRRLKP